LTFSPIGLPSDVFTYDNPSAAFVWICYQSAQISFYLSWAACCDKLRPLLKTTNAERSQFSSTTTVYSMNAATPTTTDVLPMSKSSLSPSLPLPASCPNQLSTSQTRQIHQATEAFSKAIRCLILNICASIPYCLDVISSAGTLSYIPLKRSTNSMRPTSKPACSYRIIWPLWGVMVCPHATPEQAALCRDALDYIGSAMGVKWASVLARTKSPLVFQERRSMRLVSTSDGVVTA
jgi:hypothetical protein